MLPLLMLALLGAMPIPLKAQCTNAPPSVPPSQASERRGHQKKEKALANLSDAERQQLKAAMHGIKDDPRLAAAHQAIREAQTKEARAEAKSAARQLRHDLLLKADPTLGPILDKIHPGKPAR